MLGLERIFSNLRRFFGAEHIQYEEITKDRRKYYLFWFLKHGTLSVKSILAQLKEEESEAGQINNMAETIVWLLVFIGNDTDTTTEKVLKKQRDFKKSLSNLSEQIDSLNDTVLEMKNTLEKISPTKKRERKDHEFRFRNTLNVKL